MHDAVDDEAKNFITVVTILKKPFESRTKKDLAKLVPLIREIKFFKERRDIGEADFLQICERLSYEHVEEGNKVFGYGEKGDKFYLVLKGSVGIHVPTGQKKPVDPAKKAAEEEEKRKAEAEGQGKKLSLKPEDPAKTGQAPSEPKSEEIEWEMEFVEVVTFKKGASFGELALIKNQPRAATIMAKEDCYFAVMGRKDFEKVLGKIENKKINALADYFRSLPYFAHWAKGSVIRAQYYFETKSVKRGQFIYKEGDSPDYVYIIKQGEFEVTKKAPKEEKKQIAIMEYIGPRHERLKIKETKEKKIGIYKNTDYTKLMILGVGQMFGEEDIISQRNRRTNVACISTDGDLFMIKANEFFRRVKPNEETWRIITSNCVIKEHHIENSISKKDAIVKENKQQTRNFDANLSPNLAVLQKKMNDFAHLGLRGIKRKENSESPHKELKNSFGRNMTPIKIRGEREKKNTELKSNTKLVLSEKNLSRLQELTNSDGKKAAQPGSIREALAAAREEKRRGVYSPFITEQSVDSDRRSSSPLVNRLPLKDPQSSSRNGIVNKDASPIMSRLNSADQRQDSKFILKPCDSTFIQASQNALAKISGKFKNLIKMEEGGSPKDVIRSLRDHENKKLIIKLQKSSNYLSSLSPARKTPKKGLPPTSMAALPPTFPAFNFERLRRSEINIRSSRNPSLVLHTNGVPRKLTKMRLLSGHRSSGFLLNKTCDPFLKSII